MHVESIVHLLMNLQYLNYYFSFLDMDVIRLLQSAVNNEPAVISPRMETVMDPARLEMERMRNGMGKEPEAMSELKRIMMETNWVCSFRRLLTYYGDKTGLHYSFIP